MRKPVACCVCGEVVPAADDDPAHARWAYVSRRQSVLWDALCPQCATDLERWVAQMRDIYRGWRLMAEELGRPYQRRPRAR